jgi:hypothetical protein
MANLSNLIKGPFRKIHEINLKYQHPRIHQSKTIKVLLLMLRIYLLLSVLLLIYKFATTISGG